MVALWKLREDWEKSCGCRQGNSSAVAVVTQAFQKELGKRTSSVQALKRSARELMDTGRDDTAWVRVQLQELSNRWDTVCALSVTKQTRLQQALKQVGAEPHADTKYCC